MMDSYYYKLNNKQNHKLKQFYSGANKTQKIFILSYTSFTKLIINKQNKKMDNPQELPSGLLKKFRNQSAISQLNHKQSQYPKKYKNKQFNKQLQRQYSLQNIQLQQPYSILQNDKNNFMKKQSIYLYVKKYLANNYDNNDNMKMNKKDRYRMYRPGKSSQNNRSSNLEGNQHKSKINQLERERDIQREREKYLDEMIEIQRNRYRNSLSQIERQKQSKDRNSSIELSRLSRMSLQKQTNNMLIRDSNIKNLHMNDHVITERILPKLSSKNSNLSNINKKSFRSSILQNRNKFSNNKNRKYPSEISQKYETIQEGIQVNEEDLLGKNNQIEQNNILLQSLSKLKQELKTQIKSELSLLKVQNNKKKSEQEQKLSLQEQFEKLLKIEQERSNLTFYKIQNYDYDNLRKRQLNGLRQIIDREKDEQREEQQKTQKMIREKLEKQFEMIKEKQKQRYERLLKIRQKQFEKSKQKQLVNKTISIQDDLIQLQQKSVQWSELNKLQDKSVQLSESQLQPIKPILSYENQQIQCRILNEKQIIMKDQEISQLQNVIQVEAIKYQNEKIELIKKHDNQMKEQEEKFQKKYKKVELRHIINQMKEMNQKGNKIQKDINRMEKTTKSIIQLKSKINQNLLILNEEQKEQINDVNRQKEWIETNYEQKIKNLKRSLEKSFEEYRNLLTTKESLEKQRKQSSQVSLIAIRQKVNQIQEIRKDLKEQIQALEVQMAKIKTQKEEKISIKDNQPQKEDIGTQNNEQEIQTLIKKSQFEQRQEKMLDDINKNQFDEEEDIEVSIKNINNEVIQQSEFQSEVLQDSENQIPLNKYTTNQQKQKQQTQSYQIVFENYEKSTSNHDTKKFRKIKSKNNPQNQSQQNLDMIEPNFNHSFLKQRLVTFGSRTTPFDNKNNRQNKI